MADYATTDEISAFAHEFAALGNTGQDLLATSASRLFDRLCEVDDDFFDAAAGTFSDRDFIGDGTAYLRIGPHTALNITDPVLINMEPLDAVADFVNDNVPPYLDRGDYLIVLANTRYMRPEAASYPLRFEGWPHGRQIRVSAKWGFAGIPEDVTLATAHIAIHLWRTADPAFATISNAEGAASRAVTVPQVAREIIDKYKAKYSDKAVFA